MKFDTLTFFLKNHKQNVVGKLVPDPYKNQNPAYLWIISLFSIYVQVEVNQNILKLRC